MTSRVALRIPEERIYIRLEDLIVITETGKDVPSLFVPLDFSDCVGVAGTVGFEQFLRLALELVEVRSVGPLSAWRERSVCHNDLLSKHPVSASRAERRFVSRIEVDRRSQSGGLSPLRGHGSAPTRYRAA